MGTVNVWLAPRRRGGSLVAGISATFVVLAALAGCSSRAGRAGPASSTSSSSPTSSTTTPSTPTPSTAGSGRPDHLVVVIEENHAAGEILGNPDAPYLDQLAHDGALLTRSYAVTHPSEPNYLALFSGSTHGLTDDSCPASGSPYGGPDLASALAAAGRTFTTYAESLPSAGSTTCSAGPYARKHDPATNFSDVPSSANQPFTSFPSDYSSLPAVSFVIPNLDHDMHDGTVAQADTWLRANLGGYVTWAHSHNAVLLVTWDEDDRSADNHIPTFFVGAGVRPGRYDQRVDHYGVLATICALFGATPPGQAASASPITNIWTSS